MGFIIVSSWVEGPWWHLAVLGVVIFASNVLGHCEGLDRGVALAHRGVAIARGVYERQPDRRLALDRH
jgi:hypothetical protein